MLKYNSQFSEKYFINLRRISQLIKAWNVPFTTDYEAFTVYDEFRVLVVRIVNATIWSNSVR
jgi:hypothetical protein